MNLHRHLLILSLFVVLSISGIGSSKTANAATTPMPPTCNTANESFCYYSTMICGFWGCVPCYPCAIACFQGFCALPDIPTSAGAPPSCTGANGPYTDSMATCWPDPPYVYLSCMVTTPCCSQSGAQQIIADSFDSYRECFLMDSFYHDQFEDEGLKPLSATLRNAFMMNAVMKGMFIDASNLMATALDIQKQNVSTMKNYQPSDQVCRIGTLSRSLAKADSLADNNKMVLSQTALARNLGGLFSVGSSGRGEDNFNRLSRYVAMYCDLYDNKDGLTELCKSASPAPDVNQNRDIDYTRTIDTQMTINGDFTDNTLRHDEENVIALGNYLYGHWQPLRRISYNELTDNPDAVELYNETRSVIARRAAAQNTYAAIAASRMSGSGASDQYIDGVLTRLGLTAPQIERFYNGSNGTAEGPKVPTSYNAQMEILTKKIYQDPAFFANLMDSPANVKRISASMSGIGLMQDRDIYKSTSRSEMLMALLLELEARKVANNIHSPRVSQKERIE